MMMMIIIINHHHRYGHPWIMIIPNHLPRVIEQKSESSHSEVAKCVVVLADGACHHPEIVKVEDELNE